MSKKFQRTIEDFVCEHCGAEVAGNGYTDHCPTCLWGKHVDINPGDRAADCGGPMKPLEVLDKSNAYRIQYKCQKCGHRFAVRGANNDNIEAIISLSSNPSTAGQGPKF